jgi:hypothetical protein
LRTVAPARTLGLMSFSFAEWRHAEDDNPFATGAGNCSAHPSRCLNPQRVTEVSTGQTIERELRKLGYTPDALINNYSFTNVLSAEREECHVDLAAFTQTPESYRSAAFGVITGDANEGAITERRAFGTPILFAIGKSEVGVWRVGVQGSPRLLEQVSPDALTDLFERNADRWRPQAVHRAKSRAQSQVAYQLDFVDLGLIPAIEHEVEEKLDRLLTRVDCQLDGPSDERERQRSAQHSACWRPKSSNRLRAPGLS